MAVHVACLDVVPQFISIQLLPAIGSKCVEIDNYLLELIGFGYPFTYFVLM